MTFVVITAGRLVSELSIAILLLVNVLVLLVALHTEKVVASE